jgi:NADH dehydrogenase FAD-containing subunit
MPTILPAPGESFDERSAHISAVYQAATSGKDVVVARGGLIGVELTGNFCEAIAKATGMGKVTLVTSGPVLLPGYPERVQAKAKAVLEQLGATVEFDAKVSSHTGTTLATDAPFNVTLPNGASVSGVGCYVPSFVGRAETEWLEGAPGVVLDPKAGHRVVVDAHLCGASNPSPQAFAIGGCASIKEPWLGGAKMEAQAKTVAANATWLLR